MLVLKNNMIDVESKVSGKLYRFVSSSSLFTLPLEGSFSGQDEHVCVAPPFLLALV